MLHRVRKYELQGEQGEQGEAGLLQIRTIRGYLEYLIAPRPLFDYGRTARSVRLRESASISSHVGDSRAVVRRVWPSGTGLARYEERVGSGCSQLPRGSEQGGQGYCLGHQENGRRECRRPCPV